MLLAVRLMAQMQKQFHQSLPLAALFQNRATIKYLASMLRQRSAPAARSPCGEIQPGGSTWPLTAMSYCWFSLLWTAGNLLHAICHPCTKTCNCWSQMSSCAISWSRQSSLALCPWTLGSRTSNDFFHVFKIDVDVVQNDLPQIYLDRIRLFHGLQGLSGCYARPE